MLTTKTVLGASWTVSSRVAGRAIDFVTLLVLARVLIPADFGLTAIATTLVFVLDTVLEVPLIMALTNLRHVTKSHLDTAFTLGALRGLVLSLIVLAAAWPFAQIYGDSRLIPLVGALAIGPAARSLYNPGMVMHVRVMRFRPNFAADFSGKLIGSFLSILVIYLQGGYWAIAVNSIAASVATTSISYFLASYRPAFSLLRFSEFSSFLGWFSVAQVFSALSWQFDRMLLGYFVSKSELGQYTLASDMSVIPMQSVIGPAMQPLMAAFANINSDRERLRSAYRKASRFTMMLAAPACIGMSLTADLVVQVLLGAKWSEAAVFLHWLALAVVLNAFFQPLHSLALSMNQIKLIFRLNVVEACTRIILVLAGLYFYSLEGVIVARVTMSLIVFTLSLFAARHLIGATFSSALINLWEVALSCATMAVAVLLLRREIAGRDLSAVVELVLTSAFGALFYFGTLTALDVRFRRYLKSSG